MAYINLAEVTKKTQINTTDRIAIWPSAVTSSENLQHTTVVDFTSYINTAASATFVRQNILSAKGDLYVGTASASVGLLNVGTNDRVLMVDTSTSTGLKWGQITASSIEDNVITYNKLKPLEVGTTISGTPASLDFSGPGLRTHTLAAATSSVTYTGTNYGAGSVLTIRVVNSTSKVDLNFPAGWKFVGFKPSLILPNKTAILSVTSFGTTEADCVAAWAVEI